MATTIHTPRPRYYDGERDTEGHRTYQLVWLVRSDDPWNDGPATVMQTPGLPLPGTVWNVGNDIDIWAWALPNLKVTPHEVDEGEPVEYWRVEQTFSTKPPDSSKQRCNDFQIEDPLLEPPRLSGGNQNDKVEATHDRFGRPIKNSCHEPLKGAQVEFDQARDTVRVEMNVISLPSLNLFKNRVNDSPLWGFPARSVKLSTTGWERKFYGSCYKYYTLSLEFEILTHTDPLTGLVAGGWDRDLRDIGSKVLAGHWAEGERNEWVIDNIGNAAADPDNPSHFVNAYDRKNKQMKFVILNGKGVPAFTFTAIEKYYICIQNNTGQPLTEKDFWIPLSQEPDPDAVREWLGDLFYPRGILVTYNGILYVCTEDHRGDILSPPDVDLLNQWTVIGLGLGALSFEGNWSDVTAYTAGDVVQDVEEISPGTIHVEKYPEVNFLLLGIPTSF